MKAKGPVQQVRMDMVLPSERSRGIENFIFVDDNLDVDLYDIPNIKEHEEGIKYPFKLMFLMFVYMAKGSGSLKVNLKDYEINEGDAMLLGPGSIINWAEHTPDSRTIRITMSADLLYQESHDRCIKVIAKHLYQPIQMKIPHNGDVRSGAQGA